MYTRGIPATAAAWPGPSPLRRRPVKRDRGDDSSGDGGNGRAARPTQPNPSDVREHALRGRALPVSPALPAGRGRGGNGRERAFASRPAAARAGLARGRAGVGRGQGMERRHRRGGGTPQLPPNPFPPPARPLASSPSRGLRCVRRLCPRRRKCPRFLGRPSGFLSLGPGAASSVERELRNESRLAAATSGSPWRRLSVKGGEKFPPPRVVRRIILRNALCPPPAPPQHLQGAQ